MAIFTFYNFFVLFSYRFTYWQDSGTGDTNRIPIGYEQAIENEDFENTYFKSDESASALQINKYILYNHTLCAEVSHDFTMSPKFDYFVYDLNSKQIRTFKNKEAYQAFAHQKIMPLPSRFYSFEKHFELYLVQRPFWRKWLVP